MGGFFFFYDCILPLSLEHSIPHGYNEDDFLSIPDGAEGLGFDWKVDTEESLSCGHHQGRGRRVVRPKVEYGSYIILR